MSSTGTTTSRSSGLRVPASTIVISRPPLTNCPISSIGRWVADNPIRCIGCSTSACRRSTRDREVSAALDARDRMHLVEDQRVDGAQHLARLRRQHQVERLGRRDQDVGRLLHDLAALLLRRVARAHRNPQLRLEACERAAEVALDVVVERLERRDVEHAQTLARRSRSGGRSRRGTPSASCPSRSGPGSGRGRRGNRRPAQRSAAASARRRCARTRLASRERRQRADPSAQGTPRLFAQVVRGEGDHEQDRDHDRDEDRDAADDDRRACARSCPPRLRARGLRPSPRPCARGL